MDLNLQQTLIDVLTSAASPSNEVQQQVMITIDNAAPSPSFAPALAYILSKRPDIPVEVRQRAGLLLKTSVSRGFPSIHAPEVREYVLAAIADSDATIRKTAGNVITALVTCSPGVPSSGVLNVLLKSFVESSSTISEGSFDAIVKICEDIIDVWKQVTISAVDNVEAAGILVPDFLSFANTHLIPVTLQHPNAKLKVTLMNLFATNFLFFPSHALATHLVPYYEMLGCLASSEKDPETVGHVCKGLTYIARHHPDLYATSLHAVLSFVLIASKNPSYTVRLDALQFWPVACVTPEWTLTLQSILSELLPILIDNMVYSQEDYLAMDEAVLNEEDASVPDRPEEMAPRFHKEDGADEDAEDEKEELTSTWGSEWTVRKSAASALDHIATSYRDEILGILLPIIESKLASPDWEIQESALLALGAIAHGCIEGLSAHLPSILNLLVSLSESRKPLLRSISCWTISRFSSWIAFDINRPTALPSSLNVILRRMMDRNKRVQEAAVSAFVSLEEETGMFMQEHLPEIIKTICAAMNYYQSKNLLILLDSVACLFESLENDVMSRAEVLGALVPPICAAFERVNDATEKQLSVSLFECLTAITTGVGPALGIEVLNSIIRRCGSVLELHVMVFKNITISMSSEERPEGDILACALDLLCGVIDGVGQESLSLIASINFIPLLCELICQFDPNSKLPLIRNYYSNTVKQCAFALLGDCAKCTSTLLTDDLARTTVGIVIEYVTLGPILVSNNSSWSLGELCLIKSPEFIAPFVQHMAEALLSNLNRFDASTRPIVRQNAAIAMGRLATVAARSLVDSGSFGKMFLVWCTTVKRLRNDAEKVSALRGFLVCVELSPEVALTRDNLRALHELIASVFPASPAIHLILKSVVAKYRELLGEADWNSMWTTFPAEIQFRLNHSFGLGQSIHQPPPPA